MHQNKTLILTVLPQLQSTALLQNPLSVGQITSLVTILQEPVDSFFTNPRGPSLSFNPAPLTLVKDLTSKLLFLRWNSQNITPFAYLSWTQICKVL